MTLLQKLKEQGWYLTEEGLKKVTTSSNLQTEDVKKITAAALDWDLKDIAAGALPAKPESSGFITGRIVLQIQKMRNISAPKANEESTTAPRFLQLELSDGVNTIAALELERIASLNLNVPPGTKLYMKAEKLELLQGFLVLKNADIQVLGGKVEHMVEKWEVARQMLKYARSNIRVSGSGGPPPWIAFGKRFEVNKEDLPTDRNFKSLQAATDKDKNSKENEEFNASRSQAIAEAAKAGQRKVFGGGQQNILDHNVKKILEKGFSEEDANQALRTTNNNLERALYNLKRRNNNRGGSIESNTKPTTISTGGRLRERGGPASAKEEAAAAKPQTNVSLFDFLTDKLPVSAPSANTTQSQPQPVTNNANNERNSRDSSSKPFSNNSKSASLGGNRFENNMSSSFAANRYTPRSEDKQTMQPRSNFNQRHDERKSQPPIKAARGGERSNTSRIQQHTQSNDKPPTASSSTQDNNTNPSTGTVTNNNINTNNRKNERPVRKEREQTPRQSTTGYQGNKRNNDYKATENKPYQQRDTTNRTNTETRNNSNNNQQTQQQPTQKINNFEKALDNVVEKTSKLNIQSKKESSYNNQQNRGGRNAPNSKANQQQTSTAVGQQQPASESHTNNTQQPPQFVRSQKNSSKTQPMTRNLQAAVPTPQPVAFVAPLGNGFAYDPSKIMGFQSKEANEYAMNLLKSQGLTLQQFQQQQQQAAPPQQAQVPSLPPPPPQTQQHHQQAQMLNDQAAPPPAMAYLTQNPNLFVAPPQQAPPQFGMMTGGNWPWNMGDLCLAKYWDDGNYYDAKITAISDKTCVVLFLGYGNHEEVLKSDCLPITDAQHIPLNAYQANIAGPPMPPPAFQQRGNPTGSGGGVNQRFRGERQMYVPPPKRGNN